MHPRALREFEEHEEEPATSLDDSRTPRLLGRVDPLESLEARSCRNEFLDPAPGGPDRLRVCLAIPPGRLERSAGSATGGVMRPRPGAARTSRGPGPGGATMPRRERPVCGGAATFRRGLLP